MSRGDVWAPDRRFKKQIEKLSMVPSRLPPNKINYSPRKSPLDKMGWGDRVDNVLNTCCTPSWGAAAGRRRPPAARPPKMYLGYGVKKRIYIFDPILKTQNVFKNVYTLGDPHMKIQ